MECWGTRACAIVNLGVSFRSLAESCPSGRLTLQKLMSMNSNMRLMAMSTYLINIIFVLINESDFSSFITYMFNIFYIAISHSSFRQIMLLNVSVMLLCL